MTERDYAIRSFKEITLNAARHTEERMDLYYEKMKALMNNYQDLILENQLVLDELEHDNCGIGAVVNIKGKKTHDTVANALKIVEHLEHRAGKDAEGKTGDGVGILLQISHKFFKKACKKEGFEIGDEREYGEDPGMKNEAYKNGYLTYAGDTGFVT